MICKNSSGGSVDGAVVAGDAVVDDDLGKLLREFISLYARSKMSPVAAKMSPVRAGIGDKLSGVTGVKMSPVA
jgi:hypothetical protein